MDTTTMWIHMGAVARSVVFLLALFSIWSLAVTADRLAVFARARRQSRDFVRTSEGGAGQPAVLLAAARRHPASHLARVVAAGLAAFERQSAMLPGELTLAAAERAAERSSRRVATELSRGLGSLATISATAPFVGLFGTVVGILHAFASIAAAGNGGLTTVSQGIAEALVTTALGLAVALPAAWTFNYFTRQVTRFEVEMANSTSELADLLAEAQEARYAAIH
jgi:biopolymer transport protein ExbB/TolQ